MSVPNREFATEFQSLRYEIVALEPHYSQHQEILTAFLPVSAEVAAQSLRLATTHKHPKGMGSSDRCPSHSKSAADAHWDILAAGMLTVAPIDNPCYPRSPARYASAFLPASTTASVEMPNFL